MSIRSSTERFRERERNSSQQERGNRGVNVSINTFITSFWGQILEKIVENR